MIKWTKADCERICVLMKAVFCRNTVCISRKTDKIRAQMFRKMPKSVYSAFTYVDITTKVLPQSGKYNHISVRPSIARLSVASSVNSRLEPTGIP